MKITDVKMARGTAACWELTNLGGSLVCLFGSRFLCLRRSTREQRRGCWAQSWGGRAGASGRLWLGAASLHGLPSRELSAARCRQPVSSVRSLSRTSASRSEILSKSSEIFAIACKLACGFQALPEDPLIEIPHVGVRRNLGLELVQSNPFPDLFPVLLGFAEAAYEAGLTCRRPGPGAGETLAGEEGLSLLLCSGVRFGFFVCNLKASSLSETCGNTGRTTELGPGGGVLKGWAGRAAGRGVLFCLDDMFLLI